MVTTLAVIGGLGVLAAMVVVIGLFVFVGAWLLQPVMGEPTEKDRWRYDK